MVVTGASGFIGRALCPALIEAGWNIRAVVRDRSRAPQCVSEVEVVADFATDSLQAAVANADAVVHLAARVHQLHDTAKDPLAEFRRVNRDATVRLAEASAQASVKRFVFVSSIKAAADFTSTEPLRESDPPSPGTAYGISKLEAERELEQRFHSSAMSVISLRLPLVYGPGAVANFQRLLSGVRSGIPMPIKSVRNRRSVLYIDNAVGAIIAALQHPEVRGAFFVNDGQDASTSDLVAYLADGMGIRPKLVACPVWLLNAVGKLTGRTEDVERITRSLATDSSALMKALGWKPAVSLQEGLRRTAQWYTSTKTKSA